VALLLAGFGIFTGQLQLPMIALLFATIGQMELWMVRRQEESRERIVPESRRIRPSPPPWLQSPEPGFSGYAWDARLAAWVEWRGGEPIRRCRVSGY